MFRNTTLEISTCHVLDELTYVLGTSPDVFGES